MASNNLLTKAKANKNDEFYTQISDIENELKHYEKHFKGKHVFCNCDDPEFSNFWRYFTINFDRLGLKQLTSTHYADGESSYRMDIYKDIPEDAKNKPTFLTLEGHGMTLPIGYITELEGDGDFRSEESISILKECDIVATNPPFSMFREYIAQLMEYKKSFIVMGNKNAITYKEFFSLLKNNEVWVGYTTLNGGRWMIIPDDIDATSKKTKTNEWGQTIINVAGVCWFTNLDHNKRHEELILYRKYDPSLYPAYENYDAINVDKVTEIPIDYTGIMGVPITFMDKYNPDQFEIIGLGISNSGIDIGVQPYKPEHKKYRKEVQKRGAVDGDLYMMVGNEVVVPYARILIKNKG